MDHIRLLPEILTHYNIGKLEKTLEVLKEYPNYLLKFETSRGIYVLKAYSRNTGDKDKLAKIKQRLTYALGVFNSNNITLPICRTKEGFAYVEINNEIYSIDEFVEGSLIIRDYSEEKVTAAARLLADLHKQSLSQNINGEEDIKRLRDFKSINTIFGDENSSENYSQDFINWKYQSKDKLLIQTRVLPFLRSEINLLKREISEVSPKKMISLTHGDMNPGQILFNSLGIAHLIDYESFRPEFPGYEVGSAIFSYTRFNYEKNRYELDSITSFLKNYKQIFGRPLGCDGKEVLIFLRHETLSTFGYLFRSISRSLKAQKPIEMMLRRVTVIVRMYIRLKWMRENEKQFINLFDSI